MTTAEGGAEKPVPCFRCMFEQPIRDGDCHPETCEMLTAWLMDTDYDWQKYVFGWTLRIELQNVKKYELPVEA